MNQLRGTPRPWGGHFERALPSAYVSHAVRGAWRAIKAGGLTSIGHGHSEMAADPLSIPAVALIREEVREMFGDGDWDPPQFVIRWPASVELMIDPPEKNEHVDLTPEGREYDLVVGTYLHGATDAVVVAGEHRSVAAGDVIWWRGDTPHHGVLNTCQDPRFVVYWRRR